MSMYLPNDDVRSTGAEGAEFVDTPMPRPETEDDTETGPSAEDHAEPTPEAEETHGAQGEDPGMQTDANG